MNKTKNSTIGFILGTAVLSLLAGCVGYVDGPRGEVYAPAPAELREEGVSVQDDYVYYPAYRVYYSSYRHQYVYQDGRSWVSRPAPPHVSVNVTVFIALGERRFSRFASESPFRNCEAISPALVATGATQGKA